MGWTCKHCGKDNSRKDRIFCSRECYTLSGRRIEVGKVNGPKWAENYWKRFFLLFERKYGRLDRIDQIKVAFQLGQKWTIRRGQRSDRKANQISK